MVLKKTAKKVKTFVDPNRFFTVRKTSKTGEWEYLDVSSEEFASRIAPLLQEIKSKSFTRRRYIYSHITRIANAGLAAKLSVREYCDLQGYSIKYKKDPMKVFTFSYSMLQKDLAFAPLYSFLKSDAEADIYRECRENHEAEFNEVVDAVCYRLPHFHWFNFLPVHLRTLIIYDIVDMYITHQQRIKDRGATTFQMLRNALNTARKYHDIRVNNATVTEYQYLLGKDKKDGTRYHLCTPVSVTLADVRKNILGHSGSPLVSTCSTEDDIDYFADALLYQKQERQGVTTMYIESIPKKFRVYDIFPEFSNDEALHYGKYHTPIHVLLSLDKVVAKKKLTKARKPYKQRGAKPLDD